ncbi:MAG: hypothetical protein JNK12_22230 [Acidimicrobiales bacterium]|nr:hypothetical protein [Acidimicrobiales bacterium]
MTRTGIGLGVASLVAGAALVLTPALLAVPVVGVAAEPATSATSGSSAAVTQGASEALEHEGEIFSFGITVPDEAITVGDTIVFPNNSDRPHTITDRGGTFDTGEIQPGSSGEVIFSVPGSFEVFCRINPSTMNALVEVDPGADPPDTVRIQAYDEFREGETRRFDPADLEVALGTTLSVANVGGLEHSLVATDGTLATGPIAPGAEQGTFAGTSAEVVADEPGTFEVFCEFFPDEMRGVLRVVDPSPPTTVAPTTAPPDDGGEGEAAAPAASPAEDRGVGGAVAGAVVVLLGIAAILLALVPRGRRRPAPPSAF